MSCRAAPSLGPGSRLHSPFLCPAIPSLLPSVTALPGTTIPWGIGYPRIRNDYGLLIANERLHFATPQRPLTRLFCILHWAKWAEERSQLPPPTLIVYKSCVWRTEVAKRPGTIIRFLFRVPCFNLLAFSQLLTYLSCMVMEVQLEIPRAAVSTNGSQRLCELNDRFTGFPKTTRKHIFTL